MYNIYIRISIYLSIYLSTYLSIYLSIYIYISSINLPLVFHKASIQPTSLTLRDHRRPFIAGPHGHRGPRRHSAPRPARAARNSTRRPAEWPGCKRPWRVPERHSTYWCVLRREISGMIPVITSNNHPSNPQQPIHSLRLAPVSPVSQNVGKLWETKRNWNWWNSNLEWRMCCDENKLLLSLHPGRWIGVPVTGDNNP